MNTIKFNSAVCANKGNVRSNNEDNFYFNGKSLTANDRDIPTSYESISDNDILLYGVFDGMGGEAMGEEASLCCAEVMKEYHKKLKSSSAARIQNTVLAAVREANAQICRKMVESSERRIGTTFTALCINDDKARIFNVGDTRVYMLRRGKLSQISIDDTAAQRLVNMGMITPSEANSHPDKHKLTQHLGIFEDELIIEPHVITDIEIRKGDKFLLCSDGLTDMVSDDKIESILKSGKSAVELAEELVKQALANGGVDNVTAMVVCALSGSRLHKESSSFTKKIIAIFVALILLIGAGAFAWLHNGGRDSGYSVTIKVDRTEFVVGDTGNFSATRDDEKQRDVFIYESSDENVIEINDRSGKYTVVGEGEAIITVKYSDASDSVKITVSEIRNDT